MASYEVYAQHDMANRNFSLRLSLNFSLEIQFLAMSEFHNGCGRISRVDTVVCIKLIIFIKTPEFDENACIVYLMIPQLCSMVKQTKKVNFPFLNFRNHCLACESNFINISVQQRRAS